MAVIEAKSVRSPEEVRRFEGDKGHLDLVHLEQGDVGLGTFEPGWRWSEHVKPIAGTDSCQVAHTGYVVAGRMHVRMDDGSEVEVAEGDVFHMPPGHDAWTVGDAPCVLVDFGGLEGYAKRGA